MSNYSPESILASTCPEALNCLTKLTVQSSIILSVPAHSFDPPDRRQSRFHEQSAPNAELCALSACSALLEMDVGSLMAVAG